MKKILVTGAGGFVGSRVMQQWAGRYELCTFPKGFLAAVCRMTSGRCCKTACRTASSPAVARKPLGKVHSS